MKAAIIVPIPLLKKYGAMSDYHLVLAHLVLRDETYAGFYKKRSREGDFVILDNSVMETGEPMTWDKVRIAADMVEAKEIVIPDVIGSAKETASILMAGIPTSRDTMFVPQGKDYAQWFWCLGVGYGFHTHTTVGIPKSVEKFGPRPAIVMDAVIRGFIHYYTAVHLLGVDRNPIEIRSYTGFNIRSIDLKFPVWAGQLGFRFSEERGLERSYVEKVTGRDPSLDMYSDHDAPEIAYNIKMTLKWAREHTKSLRRKGNAETGRERETAQREGTE